MCLSFPLTFSEQIDSVWDLSCCDYFFHKLLRRNYGFCNSFPLILCNLSYYFYRNRQLIRNTLPYHPAVEAFIIILERNLYWTIKIDRSTLYKNADWFCKWVFMEHSTLQGQKHFAYLANQWTLTSALLYRSAHQFMAHSAVN